MPPGGLNKAGEGPFIPYKELKIKAKPCNDSNVVVTPLMKGQARNVSKETPRQQTHFCSSLLLNLLKVLLVTF